MANRLIKNAQVRMALIIVVLMFACFALYNRYENRNTADVVYVNADALVLEYHARNHELSLSYTDIEKVHIACDSSRRKSLCGVVIFTRDGKQYHSKYQHDTDGARALQMQIKQKARLSD